MSTFSLQRLDLHNSPRNSWCIFAVLPIRTGNKIRERVIYISKLSIAYCPRD